MPVLNCFSCKICNPPLKKLTPLFPYNPPLKIEILSRLPFWKIGLRLNPTPPPPPKQKGEGVAHCHIYHVMITVTGGFSKNLSFYFLEILLNNLQLVLLESKHIYKTQQENAMLCKNYYDLLQLSFTLKISKIFGGLYITQLNIYDGAIVAKIVYKPSSIFTKRFHHRCLLVF